MIFVYNVLNNLAWPLLGILIFCMFAKKRFVKGSRQRYVTKNVAIVAIVAIIIDIIVANFTEMLFVHTDGGARAYNVIFTSILVVLYVRMLIRLLRDDDDDWFNNQWKKLKRGLKNLRAKLASKPVRPPVTA